MPIEHQNRGESAAGRPGFLFVVPWNIEDAGGVSPGGVNHVVANLFSEMAAAGRWRPLLLMGSGADPTLREGEAAGGHRAHWYLRSPWNAQHPLRGGLAFVAALPGQISTLAAFLRRHNVGVVNVHYPTLSMVPIALAKRLGFYRGRLIVSLHGADLRHAAMARGIERWWWRLFFRSVDTVITCSDGFADQVRASLPECAGRVAVVHNGLDAAKWIGTRADAAPLAPPLPSARFLLSVGKFEAKKGQDLLIRAFQRAAGSYPDLALVIIGASGPAKNSLVDLVREVELEGRVRLYENLSHECVRAVMEKALIFALPSRDEPFGIVLLEAGALHVPVVATRVGGVPEIVVDRESGRLVEPEDPEQLYQAIVELVEDSGLRTRLAAGLHHRVLERFTWKRAYDGYVRAIGIG